MAKKQPEKKNGPVVIEMARRKDTKSTVVYDVVSDSLRWRPHRRDAALVSGLSERAAAPGGIGKRSSPPSCRCRSCCPRAPSLAESGAREPMTKESVLRIPLVKEPRAAAKGNRVTGRSQQLR
jgi:hypothetical protein